MPPTRAASRIFRNPMCARCAQQWAIGLRWNSTQIDSAPPLLAKIKNDLKAAMRAKDTARLNVLRAIISETNLASKGPSPITNDMQILAMLKKRKVAAQAAAKEAEDAKRSDLATKQEMEIKVLDEYAGSVQVIAEDELRNAVSAVLESLKASATKLNPGIVMKELLQAGGKLDGKPVEKSQLMKVIQESLPTKA